jgi:hypothetical protein
MVSGVHEGGPKERKPRDVRNHLQIVSMTLQDGEELIIGQRLREILRNASKNITS